MKLEGDGFRDRHMERCARKSSKTALGGNTWTDIDGDKTFL